MSNQQKTETELSGYLSDYRALDLTDEKGFLCGKILADLGADVVKVESPGGDPSRHHGPFYHDEPDPEKSLLWWAFNTSKRGITLDITTKEGREIFLNLVKRVDFVIESFQPGYMGKLGLGYEELSKVNPKVIMISISGFGQDGPYAGYKAPDIVCMAMGGWMNLNGDEDRPPIRITVPQAYSHAGSEGAAGGLIALWHREMTGEGQWVDVSAQECVELEGLYNQNCWDTLGINMKRTGNKRAYATVTLPDVFRCKDGYVSFQAIGGTITKKTRGLVDWMEEEGMSNELVSRVDWPTYTVYVKDPDPLEVWRAFEPFFLTKTKKELFEKVLVKEFLLAPAKTTQEILEDEHFQARGVWQAVDHPEMGEKVVYPSGPCKTADNVYRIRKRAPLIGEHNDEIFRGELGLSKDQITVLKGTGVI